MPIQWPEGKKFAFTVFDDTDLATLENVREVYACLKDLGFRTTKSVWPLRGAGDWMSAGATCEDEPYVRWCLELQSQGFELGYHNSSYQGLGRQDIRRALDRFRELFGRDPKTMANHASKEAIYWGKDRLSGWRRALYGLGRDSPYEGHLEGSDFFWGDLCFDRIQYVRNFITADINTLRAFPQMPYHDPLKPWVRNWFGASEGPEVKSFLSCISESNQERLVAQGGACIMYTHFACGFQESGRVHRQFRLLMERLAQQGGWFVTVGQLLDYLVSQRKVGQSTHFLGSLERAKLETAWLMHKILTRGST